MAKLVTIACLICAAHCAAQEPGRSPFLPPDPEASADTAADSGVLALQLRGIASGSGGDKFCIYDPGSRHSLWLEASEGDADLRILSADPAHDSVTVWWKGRICKLTLPRARVAAQEEGVPQDSPSAASAPPPAVEPSISPENLARMTPEGRAGALVAARQTAEVEKRMAADLLARQQAQAH